MAVTVPIMMVGGILMAMREDLGLSWLLAIVVPALLISVGFIVSRMVPNFRLVQERIDSVNRVLREQITGIRVVRAFVREPLETERFRRTNDELTDVSIQAGRWLATMFPVVILIVNLSSVAVLWFGGHRVDSGEMQIGSLTAFLSYLMQILMSVMMGTFMLMMVPRASVCADRIVRGARHRHAQWCRPSDPVTELTGHGHLDLEGVGFTYPGADQPVLSDVSFSARPGQTVAVIGSTGAGKTTLVNLLPRLFDATDGRVVVDGVDVRRLDPDLLWSRFGLVPQKAFLFTGTVADNLRHGKPDASEEEMWEALEIAQARDFVEAMPDGLESAITQGGGNVSGGQRQRLAIARALIRKPEFYVFDDSFSALDLATDARLRAALKPVTRDVDSADRRPTGLHHPRRRPDRGARGRPRGRPRHATTSCSPTTRRTRRSSSPSSARTRQQHERPHAHPDEGDRADRRRPRTRSRPDGRRAGRPEGDDVRPLGQAA